MTLSSFITKALSSHEREAARRIIANRSVPARNVGITGAAVYAISAISAKHAMRVGCVQRIVHQYANLQGQAVRRVAQILAGGLVETVLMLMMIV
jgi:hypothetical protein